MASTVENSPFAPKASNTVLARGWSLLGRACREIGRIESGSSRVETLLELVLDAVGAERAFLARFRNGSPIVQAACSRRNDGSQQPSRSILRRALSRARPLVSVDLNRSRALAGESSVQELSLRCFLSAPVPLGVAERAVLVLDSRAAPGLVAAQSRELVECFAGLIGLALSGSPQLIDLELHAGGADSPAPHHAGRAGSFVGRSAPVRQLQTWIDRLALSDLPVLIQGETGSGKETVAGAIHGSSRRRKGPFVAVNCTALSETLLDAELFGSSRGAYTGSDRDRPGLFRLAQRGSLLLDEVGDTSPAMQAKLLRAIQEKRVRPVGGEQEIPVDVRILAATHRHLRQMVQAGRFRADLYHRLAVLEIRVPPLRERIEDLSVLVESLAPRLARETSCGAPRLAACAWAALQTYSWPGNVRELHSVLARAMLHAGEDKITARHLGLPEETESVDGATARDHGTMEEEMIQSALGNSAGSVAAAARRIGWTRQKLYRRMRALGLGRAADTSSERRG
jgi:DNA-binding NtrC family response regulator